VRRIAGFDLARIAVFDLARHRTFLPQAGLCCYKHMRLALAAIRPRTGSDIEWCRITYLGVRKFITGKKGSEPT
jgi:hypothetical protein